MEQQQIQADICINALGPSPIAMQSVKEALAGANRYPAHSDLISKLAKYHNVPPEYIALGAGTTELLRALPRAYAEDGNIVMAREAYRSAANSAAKSRIPCHLVPVDPQLNHDLNAMERKIDSATRLVLICNPNNPTGTIISPNDIKDLALSLPSGVVCVVDEAYVDFAPEVSVISEVTKLSNLVVLRSFSKVYGLAGLRVGFAVGHPTLMRKLKDYCVPYSVSTIGCVAAFSALDDYNHVESSLNFTRACLDKYNLELSGTAIKFISSPTMTMLLDLGLHAENCVQVLRSDGVIVKHAGAWDLNNYIRVTYCDYSDNAYILKKLREYSIKYM